MTEGPAAALKQRSVCPPWTSTATQTLALEQDLAVALSQDTVCGPGVRTGGGGGEVPLIAAKGADKEADSVTATREDESCSQSQGKAFLSRTSQSTQ